MRPTNLPSRINSALLAALAAAVLVFVLTGFVIVSAQTLSSDNPWKPFHFLLGQWENTADSSGALGGSTFAMELQDRILVRKNFAKYPASNGKPAINHEDLLVLYQQPGNPVEANYWDNEGHYIHYLTRVSDNGDTLTFTSDVVPNTPRFRLSYYRMRFDSLKVGFEFAPPGQPDAFKPYLTGLLHKK